MKNVMVCLMTVAAGAAFGVPYDPAVHGNPIVVTTDEAVTIEGDGATVDGGGKVRCATLGPNVTLRNFTLKNGFADWGGGVRGGRLEGCRLVDCSAALAGGAYGATLVGCTVSGCSATESGAALGDCTATGCTISANRLESSSTAAVHGGVVYGSELTDCSLTGNAVVLGPAAPAFGAVGERVTLTRCTVERNAVSCDPDRVYGLRFAQSTVDGKYADFDDGLTPSDPDDPTEPTDFDGSVAHVYGLTLDDGSVLSVSTAKMSKDGTVAVTAKLTKDGRTYSYAGGVLEKGVVVELPTCRVYGSPELDALVLRRDTATAVVSGQKAEGACLTQALFDKALVWTPDVCSRAGVAYSAQVRADDRVGPVKFSASGLPSGLKLDKATGKITGVPTKAKVWDKVKITMTSALDAKLKSVTILPIEIVPLDDWVEGTYAGGGEGGQLQQLKVAKNGKLSGKWSAGGTVWTLSAKSFDAYDAGAYVATLDCKSGKTVRTCAVTLTSEGLVGLCDVGGAFEAFRNDWKYEPWKTVGKRLAKAEPLVFRPTAFGSDADDRVTLKVSAGGAVKAKGQFVKDRDAKGRPKYYSASVSAVLCPQTAPDIYGSFVGVAYLYFQPKAKTPIASDGAKAERVVLGWDGRRGEFYGPIDAESAEE